MAYAPCFFGMTNVRTASLIIAISQLVLDSFYLANVILKYFIQLNVNKTTADDAKTFENHTNTDIYKELEYDYTVFSEIAYTITIMYGGFYLRKATQNHNLQFINFWIIVNVINLLTTVFMVVIASMRIGSFAFFISGSFTSVLYGYMVYVVYQFYVCEASAEPTIVAADQQNSHSVHNGHSAGSGPYPSASFNGGHAVVEIVPT